MFSKRSSLKNTTIHICLAEVCPGPKHKVQWQEGAGTVMWAKGVEKERRDCWTETCPDRERKESFASFFGLCTSSQEAQREVIFFWQWTLSACPSWCCRDGRIIHVFWPQEQCHALFSPPWGPWESLPTAPQIVLIGNPLRVSRPQARPPHSAVTPGGHWGVEQPGRRRLQLPSMVARPQIREYGVLLSPGKTRVIWPGLRQWTPISKARLWGKNKKTRRVKNNTIAGASLAGRLLRLCASNAGGGVGLIPGRGTRIPHAGGPEKKEKHNCNFFFF